MFFVCGIVVVNSKVVVCRMLWYVMEMDDEWWAMAKGHSFIYSIFFIVNEMNLKIEGKNEQSPALINTNGNDKREKK